nr:hypothetical protein CFP56_40302 [Quercus suber]
MALSSTCFALYLFKLFYSYCLFLPLCKSIILNLNTQYTTQPFQNNLTTQYTTQGTTFFFLKKEHTGALQVNNCFHCYCYVKEELYQDLFVRIITFKFINYHLSQRISSARRPLNLVQTSCTLERRQLRASEAASFSPSLTGNRLNGIQDLHDCVNKLLQLSFTQQALAQEQHKTWVDELLHESLKTVGSVQNPKGCLIADKGMHTSTSINHAKKTGQVKWSL